MDKFKNITAQEAKDLLTKDNYLIDIRDEDSYSASHIDGALNLGNLNIDQFIRTAEKDIPTIIYCYNCCRRVSLLYSNSISIISSRSGSLEATLS